MAGSLKNHFLVAMPNLIDSFFYHSVVYLCQHDETGAMGLIINRPTHIRIRELLNHLKINNHNDWTQQNTVLFGGPVEKEQGLVLHDGGTHWKSTIAIDQAMYLTTSSDILQDIGTEKGPEHAIVALGYAAWGKDQLEQELAENSWLTVPASRQIIFDTSAEQRWQASARLLGVDIHLLANQAGHA